ncbi:hypothetical protein GCM10011356_03850 [Kangiella profundi]|nr:hypothetical protein GCM10011356_03850 [Kangiella profundi]
MSKAVKSKPKYYTRHRALGTILKRINGSNKITDLAVAISNIDNNEQANI